LNFLNTYCISRPKKIKKGTEKNTLEKKKLRKKKKGNFRNYKNRASRAPHREQVDK
jgi:hypothetical protein